MTAKELGIALGSRLNTENVLRGTLCLMLAGLGLVYVAAGQKENDAPKMLQGAVIVLIALLLI